MQIKQIMDLIKDEQLIALGKEYQVDKVNHKITGGFILKTFVRSSLLGRAISLRSMEEMVPLSGELSGLLKTKKGSVTVDHSSIGKRLQTIKPEYFKAVYEGLVEQSDKYFSKKEKTNLHRFDSTIINLSGRIIKDGLKLGGKDKDSQIKMSVGLKGQIPTSIRFCTSQSESSEAIALVKAINEAKLDKEDILLFDRGLMKATAYEDFKRREIKFVTRINVGRRHRIVQEFSAEQQTFVNGLRVKRDALINLYNGSIRILPCDFRLVIVIDNKGKELWFLTNLSELSGIEIADIYKRRWDIEVFFKFIKQHLQFKHFISHSQNGMMVYIYSLLIAAILFTIFKVTNKLSGFKIPLLRFCLLLEKELLQDVVILSGGNWDLIKDKILPSPTNFF